MRRNAVRGSRHTKCGAKVPRYNELCIPFLHAHLASQGSSAPGDDTLKKARHFFLSSSAKSGRDVTT
jgi:hypothetical protein